MSNQRPKVDVPMVETLSNNDLDANSEVFTEEDTRLLTPAAKRALAEAEERRRQASRTEDGKEIRELGGRSGPDPVRYGDWENSGIASDF
ncbi:MAG: DUF1674 domain-containing protein [Hyphomicrobiaceae bacterium]|nr:DUF1674 domain-containing protein [Hyphomicrobiaceae bacterium]